MTQFPPKKTIHHATLLDVQASANEKDSGNSGEGRREYILVGFFVSVLCTFSPLSSIKCTQLEKSNGAHILVKWTF